LGEALAKARIRAIHAARATPVADEAD